MPRQFSKEALSTFQLFAMLTQYNYGNKSTIEFFLDVFCRIVWNSIECNKSMKHELGTIYMFSLFPVSM